MHIRPADLNDLPNLVILGRILLTQHGEYDNTYYQLEENFDELFGNWIKEQINHQSQFIFVAQNENDGQIAGFISGFVKYLFPWFQTKTVGHISYMIIDTNRRHQGIGRLLENAARDWFKAKNISHMELYVEEKNYTGQSAWYKYGFMPFKKFLQKKI